MADRARSFTDAPAVRAATPLWIGLVGPSGGGKTFSALRLATGMQRELGGEIFVIDSEARRALHYADRFTFRHVDFKAPFSPADYLAAIKHCVDAGARVIVIDSMSHLWEGTGGVIEMHDAELDRRAGTDDGKRARMNLSCWIKPKAELQRLINGMLGMPVSFVLCFRAKEKLRVVRGKDPEERGWQPIGPDALVYELTMKALLPPGADGVPLWRPEHEDERRLVKLPEQFRELVGNKQLDEDLGAKLARWSAGGAPASSTPRPSTTAATPTAAAPAPTVSELLTAYAVASTTAELDAIGGRVKLAWKAATATQREDLKAAVAAAKARLAAPPSEPSACPACGSKSAHAPGCPEAPPDEPVDESELFDR